MNRKISGYVFAGGIAVGAIAAFILLVGDNDNKSKENAPEQVVETFNRALASGDFVQAYALCDTSAMKEYIDNYKKEWEKLEKTDSSMLAIASEILSAAAFTFTNVEKDGNRRHITYSIDAGEGLKKEKMTTVRKEEGEWKVEASTDKN